MIDPKIIRQPSSSDPAEQRIRAVLEQELLSTSWAKKAINTSRKLLSRFMSNSVHILEEKASDNRGIRQNYEDLLDTLNKTLKTNVKDGRQYLDGLKGSPVILITNHLGTTKLARFREDEVARGLEIEPFPIRHCAFKQISDALGYQIYEAAVELPGKLLEVQKACGVVTIPSSGEGRTEVLINKVKEVINTEPNALLVMYPEGGTTGKRNGGGPYDLEQFHKGAIVTAKDLSIPILPVVQYFNPNGGLELYVLPPVTVQKLNTLDLDVVEKECQDVMQKKLDLLKH